MEEDGPGREPRPDEADATVAAGFSLSMSSSRFTVFGKNDQSFASPKRERGRTFALARAF
jgi:hypothetical protein